jgi:hypothetical protein
MLEEAEVCEPDADRAGAVVDDTADGFGRGLCLCLVRQGGSCGLQAPALSDTDRMNEGGPLGSGLGLLPFGGLGEVVEEDD